MTAVLIDQVSVVTPSAGVRVRPGRTAQGARRVRAGADPRRTRLRTFEPSPEARVNACRVGPSRPRVTIGEAAVPAPWVLTERGWAVVVLGVLLAFGSGLALVVAQFLAVTGG